MKPKRTTDARSLLVICIYEGQRIVASLAKKELMLLKQRSAI